MSKSTTNVSSSGASCRVQDSALLQLSLKCRVCGASADGQHFGTSACRACAAFFRRTISRRLRYICRFDNDCEIGNLSRSVCRSCRLEKCLEVGMNGRAVRSQQINLIRPEVRHQQPCLIEVLPSLKKENTFIDADIVSKRNRTKQGSTDTNQSSDTMNTDLYSISTVYDDPPMLLTDLNGGFTFFAVENKAFSFTPIVSSSFASSIVSSTALKVNSENSQIEELDASPLTAHPDGLLFDGSDPILHDMATDMRLCTASISSQDDSTIGCAYNVDVLSIQSSSSSVCSSSTSCRKLLYDIVKIKAIDFFVDQNSLPVSHPTLTKVQIGYESLQRRRDAYFSRVRQCDGYSTRVFIERQIFDVHQYWKNLRMEIEWVAEWLSTFDNYALISNPDKVQIFKHYWIHFIILERCFDSHRVLGASPADLRMVFANGDINDVVLGEYDIKNITAKDYGSKDVLNISHPWFRSAALEIIMPLKKLQPTEPEMMFCLTLMFWRLTYDLMSKVTSKTIQLAEQMTELLYNELFTFYSTHFTHVNYVKRIGELVRLIGITERLVLHRKEDIIMQRTFRPFKVDLYMEEIFESD